LGGFMEKGGFLEMLLIIEIKSTMFGKEGEIKE
jgi:hypothetical protein